MRRVTALALLAPLVASCGDDSGVEPNECSVILSVEPPAEAPTTIIARATVQRGAALSGLISIIWTVSGPDGAITPIPRDPDAFSVDIPADTAGAYSITVSATVGGTFCPGDSDNSINVPAPNAATATFRLRYTPLAGQPAPPQEDPLPLVVSGGADAVLPARTLDGGQVVSGLVTGPFGGVTAYLRLVPPGGGRPTELFAGADGAYAGRVPTAPQDLLIVPADAEQPPKRFAAQGPAELAGGYLLDAGERVDGVILDSGGAAVAGARVALAPAGMPSVVATTGADGTFVALVRAADGPFGLTVVPPAGAAWPQLEQPADPGLALADGTQLEIVLAAAPVATFAASAARSTGEPLGGARVTFVPVAPAGAAAQLRLDGGAPAPLAAAGRATAVADAAGALPAIALPHGVYTVLVDLPAAGSAGGDGPAAMTLDLSAGAPATPPVFATAALASAQVTVRDPAGAPVAGARVVAVARGVAGVGVGASVAIASDASGVAVVPVAPAMTYDLLVEPPRGARLARARAEVGAATAPLEVTLPAGLVLRGTLLFPGGAGQPGIAVAVVADGVPVAEAVTEAGGEFTVVVPDPGLLP